MMVSRGINKRYNQVSAKNIKRIEAIIKKHNFIPNSAAQSLSSKSSKIIAMQSAPKSNMNVILCIASAIAACTSLSSEHWQAEFPSRLSVPG
ncbi:MAG TPA: hypothetical protein DCZ91_11725 [Lachnospiraceae bacterium]|nr:hypothetical protein [Lachnospiraceae bacterium]